MGVGFACFMLSATIASPDFVTDLSVCHLTAGCSAIHVPPSFPMIAVSVTYQGPGVWFVVFMCLVLNENDKDVCKNEQSHDCKTLIESPAKAGYAVDFHAFASSSA